MPLLDHFHAPLAPRRHWESFHVNWAGAIADDLNERLLPDGYFAEEHVHFGPRVEIDVATFANELTVAAHGGVVTSRLRTWAPPAPSLVIPGAFPDQLEVQVFENEGGSKLVAAVELVSPANKDRPASRRAFAIKCASYLAQGVGLVIIDIVTSRAANLHHEILDVLGHDGLFRMAGEPSLYAVAYRPIVREQNELIDLWAETLDVGRALPVLPLALDANQCVPLDLETTYVVGCQRRRLP